MTTLVTVEDLGDATAELLALLFVARGLDPRRASDLPALREQLGALDDETNPGPRRRQVDPWRRLLARSEALSARLGIEEPLEPGLTSQLLEFKTLVVERVGLEERLPRWRPRRFAATQWHVERRELEARIDDQLGRVIVDVVALAMRLAESETVRILSEVSVAVADPPVGVPPEEPPGAPTRSGVLNGRRSA